MTNLLNMTRLERGEIRLRREWVPIDELVGSARGAVEKLLGEDAVVTRLDPDLPLLSVDPVLIEQLLVNLLENAVRHGAPSAGRPAEPVELAVRRDGKAVEITVSDRGPGLPPEVRDRAFQKFVRGAGAGAGGVGLGLAICHAIATAHGGSIVAEPRSGGGTVFRVRLPIGDGPAVDFGGIGELP